MATTDRLPNPSDTVLIISNIANGDVVATEQFQDAGMNVLQDVVAYLLRQLRRLDGSATVQFAYSATNTLSLSVASGLAAGDPVVASTSGTLPTGMSTLTTYYIKTISGVEEAATCTLSATYGGAALSITGAGSGVHSLTPLRPFVHGNQWAREYDVPDSPAATFDPVQYQIFRLPATHTTNPNTYTLPDLNTSAGFNGMTRRVYRNVATTGTARIIRADATTMATFSSTTPDWADFRWDDSDAQWRVIGYGPNITIAEV